MDFLFFFIFEAIKAKVLRKDRDVIQDSSPGFQQVFVYTVKIFNDYKVFNLCTTQLIDLLVHCFVELHASYVKQMGKFLNLPFMTDYII